MDEKIAITVQIIINIPVTKIWKLYTLPEHIMQWNNASDDWCTVRVENDLRVGGKLLFRMEAKNASSGFDFEGTYDEVKNNELISYTIIGGRKVRINFSNNCNATIITQTFEAENINSIEMQKAGWQAILDNFKKYVEKKNINKIIPCLWFDNQAEEAAHFYTSIFNNSKITSLTHYNEVGYEIHGKSAGTVMAIDFEIENQKFLALNGGPYFKFNPSISFFISCPTKEEVDILWKKLIENGKVLMPLDSYPFSERYCWLQDKYGLSWQIMFMGNRETKQKIISTFMFVNDICGKTEEAINYYAAIFNNSKVSDIVSYSKDNLPDKEGTITHASFMLEEQWFVAMDSAHTHNFAFNETI